MWRGFSVFNSSFRIRVGQFFHMSAVGGLFFVAFDSVSLGLHLLFVSTQNISQSLIVYPKSDYHEYHHEYHYEGSVC